MISLSKAKEIADDLNRDREIMNMIKGDLDFEIPSSISLHNWKRKGVITGVLDYRQKGQGGGRVGLYHETLPIQIATAAELKIKYTLSEIADITNEVLPLIIDKGDDIKKAVEYVGEKEGWQTHPENILPLSHEMIKAMYEADNREEIKEAEEKMLAYVERKKRACLIQEYKTTWLGYEEIYNSIFDDYKAQ